MAIPREKIVIAASGKSGADGFQTFGHRDHVAQFGRQGANGRSSCAPTNGTDGQDISIKLAHSETDNAILVEGADQWTGTRWLVPQDQVLLLDCKGGDGGRGGIGEDGQQGGQGARGRNATKHAFAEDGHEGARGGDGGYGTNGGSGGKAGKVLISVNEDDLDLLLPIYWDVRGGKPGEGGTHGNPGDGGEGGEGGDGITWTERRQDSTITHTRPPGNRGRVGPPGARPGSYLTGGTGGTSGSSQVTVLRNDGTQSTYPTRYEVKVVSFEVVDENDDGINEPGEHILVRNIRVQNTGGMPTPKNRDIRVLIAGSHWLDPIVSEPVIVPPAIPVGATVEIPGVLRAFIMNERVPRNPKVPFAISEDVQLIATMGRVERTLPEFSGRVKINIRYPLELDPPRYLDCIAPGGHITFSWTLRNISRKPYGINGRLGRRGGTCLTDPGHIFDFVEAEEDNKHEILDLLDVLDPGSEVPISQTFKVSDLAFPYSQGHLNLELLLSEPGTDEGRWSSVETNHPGMRSIMSHPIKMQISGVYHYNPHSAYLMVVNSATPNSTIHRVIRFIRNELMLHLDIFNLSVGGSFIDPATGRSVLSNYMGKSIIIFANVFSYFSQGTKTAFDLLDPWLCCQLAKGGTSFLFNDIGNNVQAMTKWGSMTTFPIYTYDAEKAPDATANENIQALNAKEILAVLHTRVFDQTNSVLPIHTFPVKGNQQTSVGRRTAPLMNKNFPLRRFAITGDGTVVAIREGFPKTAFMTASLVEFGANDSDIPDYQKYMIIAVLPFKARACMYWNMVGVLDGNGVQAGTLLGGDGLQTMRTGVANPTQDQTPISEKLCKAICLSVETDLSRELALFHHNNPWPDVVPKTHSLQQLMLLHQFFSLPPPTNSIASSERLDFMVQTLGLISGALLPIGFRQWFSQVLIRSGSRKARLRPQVASLIEQVLVQRFAPDVAAYLRIEIAKNAKETKRAIKSSRSPKRDTDMVCKMRFATLVGIPGASYHDFTTADAGSVFLGPGETQAMLTTYMQWTATITMLVSKATIIINEIVTPVSLAGTPGL